MAAELTVATIPDPQGEGMRLLWLLRDITERTRAEEALRQAYEEFEQRVRERTAALAAENNAVKRLAYSMSQDLRAPLVTLRGFANELRTACDLLKAALPPLLLPVEPPQRTAVSQTSTTIFLKRSSSSRRRSSRWTVASRPCWISRGGKADDWPCTA